jgi:hypothetical protein
VASLVVYWQRLNPVFTHLEVSSKSIVKMLAVLFSASQKEVANVAMPLSGGSKGE